MLRLRCLLFRPQNSSFFCRGFRADPLRDEGNYELQRDREVLKDFYKESEITANRTEEEIQAFKTKHNITVDGIASKPILTIDELQLPLQIKQQFEYHKIHTPTPIQSMCWPMILKGNDMIGIAQTGSGKTLTYLLPSAIHIQNQPLPDDGRPLRGPTALILAPTRELVQQISDVAHNWLGRMRIRHAGVYGGASRMPQIDALRRGAAICVATPGRLQDLLDSHETTLSNSSYLVLDEADRMLDMGFEPQIREIIKRMRPDRQTVMFSATWPNDVRELATNFMLPDTNRINIGSTELCANRNIKQEIRFVDDDNTKLDQLLELVAERPNEKILVFAATKRRVSFLSGMLHRKGIRCVESHGDVSQSRRERALQLFRSSNVNVMVATDVAARGLDVQDIKVVVNMDFPQTIEDYVHRIGRTGRSNSTGTSITFFTSENKAHARDLVNVLKQAEQEVPQELTGYSREMIRPPSFRREYQKKSFSRFSPASNWRHAARRY